MNMGLLIAQLVNMFLILLVITVPVATVVWVVVNIAGNRGAGGKMLLQKLDDDSYVHVRLDDVEKVEILNNHEAVIHLEGEQKMIIKPEDARRVIRKLS